MNMSKIVQKELWIVMDAKILVNNKKYISFL